MGVDSQTSVASQEQEALLSGHGLQLADEHEQHLESRRSSINEVARALNPVKRWQRVAFWGLAASILPALVIIAIGRQNRAEAPLVTDDAQVLGILLLILVVVFTSESSGNRWLVMFYRVIPSLLLCYFIPALMGSANVFSANGDNCTAPDQPQFLIIDCFSGSALPGIATNYLLPATLALLTLSIDLPGITKLGAKSILMFLVGTASVICGGPLAILIMRGLGQGDVVSGNVWRGLATIAGSWIGGGANQAAMRSVFLSGENEDNDLFSIVIAVDVFVANVWLGILLFTISRWPKKVDELLHADASSIEELRDKLDKQAKANARVATTSDLLNLLAVGFGATGISSLVASTVAPWLGRMIPETAERLALDSEFFWLVIVTTTLGLLASFTPLRQLEHVGAAKLGSLFLYVLITTIGMQMDILAIGRNPGLFAVGFIWISFHAICMLTVARLINAPLFFIAVGSQANIGGAASAPIVASAFHPALAPVGVLLAVLGYALGTYGAWLCGILMRAVAPDAF